MCSGNFYPFLSLCATNSVISVEYYNWTSVSAVTFTAEKRNHHPKQLANRIVSKKYQQKDMLGFIASSTRKWCTEKIDLIDDDFTRTQKVFFSVLKNLRLII